MESITKYMDYTILKADAKKEDIIKLCNEAKTNNCASVCINPFYVKLAKEELKGSDVKVCTVVGFPLGATCTKVKAFEAECAINNGASEIDMVINVGALKNKEYDVVKNDIEEVLSICIEHGVILKVIIETCLLTDEEKRIVANIIVKSGADFVKTSTGFSTAGALVSDIKLIKEVVGDKALIKASGGIRDYQTALEMIAAGADRLGVSKLILPEEK